MRLPIQAFATAFLVIVTGPTSSTVAQTASSRASIIISPQQLAAQLNDPETVVLQVGNHESYMEAHIPGAHAVALSDFRRPRLMSAATLNTELPDPKALEELLEGIGVTNQSRIVLVWADQQVTHTTRILFTLDWAGLGQQTAYVDGGLDAWREAGFEVETGMRPAVTALGQLTVRPRTELLVDANWVAQNASRPGYAVLDARAAMFYDGVREDRGAGGHVPGAGSLPWLELVDDKGKLKTAAELRALFESAGVEAGDVVIAYCHIGQYATAVILAARTLGHEVRLYDGAWQDWAARGMPVETTNNE